MYTARKRIFLSVGSLIAASLIRPAFNGKADEKVNQVYIWGNGFYQAMPGISGTSFANFTPKLINVSDKHIEKMFLSKYFEGGINSNGDLLIWETHKLSSAVNTDVDDSQRKKMQKIQSPDKSAIKEVHVTKGFIWVLTSKGDVYQYPIENKLNQETQEVEEVYLNPKSRKIQSLQKIKQIDTGEDHFIAVDDNGHVYSMGDDTYGQCGLGQNKRSTAPPFYETRIRNPTKINGLPTIRKIRCGDNHTIAIGVEGGVYVWGSNSKMQLSQQQEYSKIDQPLIAVYSPIRLSAQMEQNNKVVDVAAGSEFTIIVTENHTNGETEVFGCGHNLKGEIGGGFIRHLSDVIKIEGLSNYRIKTEQGEQNVTIKQIECGKYHCMALMNIGAILEWGDNEYGQMGNKKRSTTDTPILMSTFSKQNVHSIACGNLQSAVIVQNLVNPQKK